MSLVFTSTVSLSSKNMGDLKSQIQEFLRKNAGDGRTYQVGPYYEPVPGYVAVDIGVFVPVQVVQRLRAMEEFDSEENKSGQIH